MAKKATKSISEDGNVLSFVFAEEGVDDLVATITELSEDIISRLAMHGLSAKMGDSYAGADTVSDARESAAKVLEELSAGNWTTRVAGAGGPRVTQLAEALVRVAGARGKELTLEQAVEALGGMPDEQKKGLRKSPEIKQALAEIKIEKLNVEAKKASESETPADNTALDSLFGSAEAAAG